MAKIIDKQNALTSGWYEKTCQQLDAFRISSKQCQDEGEILPPDELYDKVKEALKDLCGLQNLSKPQIGLGPEGQISLTWRNKNSRFHVLFTNDKVIARLTTNSKQKLVEKNSISETLNQFAA